MCEDSIISAETVCRVCLVNNLKLYGVQIPLRRVYELLTGEKYDKVGFPVTMCNICLSDLQKCFMFMETAIDTNKLLEQWCNEQNELKAAKPRSTHLVTKVNVLSGTINISLEPDDTEMEEVNLEPDRIDCNIQNIKETKETDNNDFLVDSPNDNDDTDTNNEVTNERQTDTLQNNTIDTEKSISLAPTMEVHTNIEISKEKTLQNDNDNSQICQDIATQTDALSETMSNDETQILIENEFPNDLSADIKMEQIHGISESLVTDNSQICQNIAIQTDDISDTMSNDETQILIANDTPNDMNTEIKMEEMHGTLKSLVTDNSQICQDIAIQTDDISDTMSNSDTQILIPNEIPNDVNRDIKMEEMRSIVTDNSQICQDIAIQTDDISDTMSNSDTQILILNEIPNVLNTDDEMEEMHGILKSLVPDNSQICQDVASQTDAISDTLSNDETQILIENEVPNDLNTDIKKQEMHRILKSLVTDNSQTCQNIAIQTDDMSDTMSNDDTQIFIANDIPNDVNKVNKMEEIHGILKSLVTDNSQISQDIAIQTDDISDTMSNGDTQILIANDVNADIKMAEMHGILKSLVTDNSQICQDIASQTDAVSDTLSNDETQILIENEVPNDLNTDTKKQEMHGILNSLVTDDSQIYQNISIQTDDISDTMSNDETQILIANDTPNDMNTEIKMEEMHGTLKSLVTDNSQICQDIAIQIDDISDTMSNDETQFLIKNEIPNYLKIDIKKEEMHGMSKSFVTDNSQICQDIAIQTDDISDTMSSDGTHIFNPNAIPNDLNSDIEMEEIHESDEDILIVDEIDLTKTSNIKSNSKTEILTSDDTQNAIKLQICVTCNEKFTLARDLIRHISERHIMHLLKTSTKNKLKQGTFSNNECKFLSERSPKLKEHLNSHSGEGPFSCKICGIKFRSNFHLAIHSRIHTGNKIYDCDVCGYKTARLDVLKSHLMKIHPSKKCIENKLTRKTKILYSCNECTYTCVKSCDLEKHLKSHNGEQLFSCKFCKYKCLSISNLKTHLSIHTGEKPFSCKFC